MQPLKGLITYIMYNIQQGLAQDYAVLSLQILKPNSFLFTLEHQKKVEKQSDHIVYC